MTLAAVARMAADRIRRLPSRDFFQPIGESIELGCWHDILMSLEERRPDMLVLSRSLNDKVVFPTLGIRVEVLRVAGSKVRLGIDAPPELPVHREEVWNRLQSRGVSHGTAKKPAANDSLDKRLSHTTRNRLNSASLGLHLLQRQLGRGDPNGAEATIFRIFNELKEIETELDGSPQTQCNRTDKSQHRALVVEDDDNERELLAAYLRVSGFEVDTAADGLQAMVRLTEKQPDVVLLDMRMPRCDGRSTVSAIRTNPDYRALKLFAVSGSEPDEMNVTLGPTGVDRWFSKPLDPKTLVDTMRDVLTTERILA
jgi:carbon storage regulator CsrA